MSHLAVPSGRRLRFSALKKGIEGITQRILTLTVRNLERDGLLERHCFPEVPPARRIRTHRDGSQHAPGA